jgi:hypothetical protein
MLNIENYAKADITLFLVVTKLCAMQTYGEHGGI